MARLPKYSSELTFWELGGLLAVGVRCSEPNAEEWRSLRVSDVLASLLALMKEDEGDSKPNLEGTDDGQGAAGKRAALEMPLESNDAGKGASKIDNPLPFNGERPRPSRGEPYVELGSEYGESEGWPLSTLSWWR